MDDLVKAALKKWPDVPHCYGWLALDARGDWYMRDERIQAAGPFPQVKGSRIVHEKLREFIERNYEHDTAGAWFFQNGPQRVYVQLEATPWIWRLSGSVHAPLVHSHTGRAAQVKSCWLDEQGHLYLQCDLGIGLLHSLDMNLAGDLVEAGVWLPQDIRAEALPLRFGFQRTPLAASH
jgi:hypothetical protein